MDAQAQTHATRLVIDARAETIGGLDLSTELLGLTLIQRTVLAAWRAGFETVSIQVDDADTAMERLVTGISDVAVVAGTLPSSPDTVFAAGNLLGEVGWLSHLRTGQNDDLSAHPPLTLGGPESMADAEKRLLAGLTKETDGFMSRHLARPLSLRLSRHLAPLGVTPNQMTVVCMLIGLAAAPFFLYADPVIQVIGGLLFVVHSITDGCDGELARLTFRESRFGGLFDFISDNFVHVAIFVCMAMGWSEAWGEIWPLYLGAGAVLGTAGSAFAVYWLTMRKSKGPEPVYTSVSTGPSQRLGKVLDDLSRRDFIYLVFVLSVFGQAHWFVGMAGIGAPVFCVLVLYLAAADARRQRRLMP